MISFGLPFINDLSQQKITCTADPQNTTVIKRLLPLPAISICFKPHLAMGHIEDGMIRIPVWSQFKINSTEISSMSTVTLHLSKICFSVQQMLQDSACAYTIYLLLFMFEFINFVRMLLYENI